MSLLAKEMELLQRQVKGLKAKGIERLNQIVDAVARLKAQGQDFETIRSQFLTSLLTKCAVPCNRGQHRASQVFNGTLKVSAV